MTKLGDEITAGKVRILIVDDKPDRHFGLSIAIAGEADVQVKHPSDVTIDDLAEIDLVSVDEYFDDEWAGTLDEQNAAIRNIDGLAVAAAFRSHARALSKDFAVSLHSGELARLAAGLPLEAREQLTAAQHDLDWVFAFGQEGFGKRLSELARSVRSATDPNTSFRADAGARWLEIPDRAWGDTARDQVQACRPPAHGLAENTGGRSYVRWLAQRVLPYPTFVYDRDHSSNLLGIHRESFALLLESLQDREVEYTGPLNTFIGPRWWRAGLQALLRESGVSSWDSSAAKSEALSSLLGVTLKPLPGAQTVVAYDAESRVVDTGVDVDDAIRINIDGWPVFADDPWALISSVESDVALLRLVAPAERPAVSE